MKKIYLLITIALSIVHYTQGQFTQTWAHALGSTNGDIGYNITKDPFGNVIVTGHFNGTVDFDPGTGVYNLTAHPNNTNDIFIAKYSSAGALLWAHRFGDLNTDAGACLTTDAVGNIYIGMSFDGTIDFDPGPGVANFTAPGLASSVFAKYDANGDYQWAVMIASTSTSSVAEIKLDASNNLIVAGSFHGTVDFDPGAGVANVVSNGNSDIFFGKYDVNGNYIWVKSMGAAAFDASITMELDPTGAIFLAGYFRLTVDFDPGTGVANLVSVPTLNDIFFAKYDANGNYVWAKSIGSSSNDAPGGIAVDASGNVLLSGFVFAAADFDPGPGNVTLTPQGKDGFIAKYDANGNYLWAHLIGGTSSDGFNDLISDGANGFYVIGDYSTTVDFDPGAGTFNLTANGNSDVVVARYNSNGGLISAFGFGGPTSDLGAAVALVDLNTILITGYFVGTVDLDPGTGVNNFTSAGIFDIFLGKYFSSGGALPVKISSFNAGCNGESVHLSWTSEFEMNVKEYVVEKSYDGLNFEVVKKVKAKGTSNVPVNYAITDIPLVETIYYRLRSEDTDGKQEISKIVTAECNRMTRPALLFPNPARDIVHIANEKLKGNVQVTIVDESGRIVKTLQINVNNAVMAVNISDLKKGVYSMRLDSKAGSVVFKVFKM